MFRLMIYSTLLVFTWMAGYATGSNKGYDIGIEVEKVMCERQLRTFRSEK